MHCQSGPMTEGPLPSEKMTRTGKAYAGPAGRPNPQQLPRSKNHTLLYSSASKPVVNGWWPASKPTAAPAAQRS